MDTISTRCYRVNCTWTEVLLTLQISFLKCLQDNIFSSAECGRSINIAFVGRDELVLVQISVTASKFISVSDVTLLCFNKHFITMSRTNYASYKKHYIEYLL